MTTRRVSFLQIVVLVLAIGLVPLALGVRSLDDAAGAHAREQHRRDLAAAARTQATALDDYFARSRGLTLLAARESALQRFFAAPGDRLAKLRAGGGDLVQTQRALGYLEELYPDSIGEACVIDERGHEIARVVRGEVAPIADLSLEEAKVPFFAPTMRLRPGQVHQALPYQSPDTGEWVVANATPLPLAGGRRALLHFEVTIESFRRTASRGRFQIAVVDRRTGQVVLDSERPQRGARLVARRSAELARVARDAGATAGVLGDGGRPIAFHRLRPVTGNANDWVVVARAAAPAGAGLADGIVTLVVLAVAVLLLVGLALAARWRRMQDAALVDALTGLPNRRAFADALETAGERARRQERHLSLVMLDVDGLKGVNDRAGHQAGDQLLLGMAGALRDGLPDGAEAFRVGGDEFAVLVPAPQWDAFGYASRLTERLERAGLTAGAGIGEAAPGAAVDDLVRRADLALIEAKRSGRSILVHHEGLDGVVAPGDDERHQHTLATALARAVDAKDSWTRSHCETVAELSALVAHELGLAPDHVARVRLAGLVHDVGKIGVPDAILQKPARLTAEEYDVIKGHASLGHRILSGTELTEEAVWVRHHHERVDGGGYPDRLAGEAIPFEARILHVADAFEAMTSDRPYRDGMPEEAAIEELAAHAGTQFDPDCVAALVRGVRSGAAAGAAPAGR